MGIFDVFKKEKKVEVVEVPKPTNKYYNDVSKSFNYQGTIVRIGEPVLGYNDVYECELTVAGTKISSYIYNDQIKYFKKVLASLDRAKMIEDEKYAEYVLSEVLYYNRVLDLQKAEFDPTNTNKFGNYVGTVVNDNEVYKLVMDEAIGKYAEESQYVKDLHTAYTNEHVEKAKEEETRDAAKIDELKKEIAAMQRELASLQAKYVQPQEEEKGMGQK